MNYLFLKLLYDCKNIALANDDILLAVELDLGAGVLAGDDLLALRTSILISLPSTTPPGPTSMISATCGFS